MAQRTVAEFEQQIQDRLPDNDQKRIEASNMRDMFTDTKDTFALKSESGPPVNIASGAVVMPNNAWRDFPIDEEIDPEREYYFVVQRVQGVNATVVTPTFYGSEIPENDGVAFNANEEPNQMGLAIGRVEQGGAVSMSVSIDSSNARNLQLRCFLNGIYQAKGLIKLPKRGSGGGAGGGLDEAEVKALILPFAQSDNADEIPADKLPDGEVNTVTHVVTKGAFTQDIYDLIQAGDSDLVHYGADNGNEVDAVIAAHKASHDHPAWMEITTDFDHVISTIDHRFKAGQYWYFPPFVDVPSLVVDVSKILGALGIHGDDGSVAANARAIASLKDQVLSLERHGTVAEVAQVPNGINVYADIDREYTFSFVNPADAPEGVKGVFIVVAKPGDADNTGVSVSTRVGIGPNDTVSFQVTAARKLILDAIANDGVNLHELEFRYFFYNQAGIDSNNIVRSDAPAGPSLSDAIAVVRVPFYIGARPNIPNVLIEPVNGVDGAGETFVELPENYSDWKKLHVAVYEGAGDDIISKDIHTALLAVQSNNKDFLVDRGASGANPAILRWTTNNRRLTRQQDNDTIIYAVLDN